MFKMEKKLLEWIHKYIFILSLVGVTALSLCIRWGLRDFVSPDSESFLLYWYDLLKEAGGLRGLNQQVGNYNMLYQFLIAVMTYLPIEPLYAYKLLSVIFDYLMAVGVAILVYELTTRNQREKAGLAYMAVILFPCVFLNSSAWAQCDSIYTFFIITSLIAALNEKYVRAFLLLGVAFAFKLQAAFILPFFLFLYFARKKFSAVYFFLVPLMMGITALPCILMGRGVKEIFIIYRKQADYYKVIYMNYPSIWAIISDSIYVENYNGFRFMTMALTIAVLGLLMLYFILKKVDLNRTNLLYIAFLLTYTCVLLLPGMHERYGFCYEILAIVIVFINRKTLPLLLSLGYLSFSTYGCYLFEAAIDMRLLATVNLITYIGYLLLFLREMGVEVIGKKNAE